MRTSDRESKTTQKIRTVRSRMTHVDPTPPTDRINSKTALLLDPILDPRHVIGPFSHRLGPANELALRSD
jgi:hypothetical protein